MPRISIYFVCFVLVTFQAAQAEHVTPPSWNSGSDAFTPPKLDPKQFARQLSKVKESGAIKGVQKVAYGIYTRGKDDVGAVDENKISNYRTAQHFVALQPIKTGKGIELKLVYDAELVTKEFQAVLNGARYMLGETSTNIPGSPGEKKKLEVTVARKNGDTGPLVPGSILKQALNLGNIQKDGKYEGTAKVRFGGESGTFPDGDDNTQQTIGWRIEVKDGSVVSTDVYLQQRGSLLRPASDMLALVGSSSHVALQVPHPLRTGEVTGEIIIGEKSR